ncbi:MAG: phosphate ABC transporter permease PstA [Chlorobium sp.]|uniref:phosphate ABC transporter permease PstA n=1 Tax=Chlorobium sp. TaxID=1095 RepID=UPI0025BF0D17|nr:phosphate ABC transporter permease PstA [Chlorobium sp.]MCF8216963.1 phosphate ABC transporter permease PstA [Chlorobium sp.]MCF8271792.1 phosphate ABC transporter permease PstA [Chlorobium sp.]MCF8288180.1 phosphate ABC transporter permease PstA [Chlorobium sp.]MCF8291772.1 phosphate ABC transporter permease PstA [Chlorobium sp.]MCF8385864.1 phosphate ABC transporter permease PstA [Chlorobium sp.]
MNVGTRKILNRSFTAVGIGSIVVMAIALLIVIVPIIYNGVGAVFFTGTIEHRNMLYNEFGEGDEAELAKQNAAAGVYRKEVYAMLAGFEAELEAMESERQQEFRSKYGSVRNALTALMGPLPGDTGAMLTRFKYGQTRWEKAEEKLHEFLYEAKWDYSDPDAMAKEYYVSRAAEFEGTSLVKIFPYVEKHLEEIMRPEFTIYLGFLTDSSVDSHIFGGIWPEIQGTFFLAIGAMLFAFPLGVIAAVYFTEYAREGLFTSMLRSANSTLAGVPSIVFGLFGLAFFINTLGVSESKSVLAGSLTLAIMILPTIIRAAEEAILSVPRTYKEASLSLGSTKWNTIMTVILPAALPGIITGGVISLGRAAGETAPIIFTAAVSVGSAIGLADVFSSPTPALSWNIYNLASEHEAAAEIRHVQYGMVLALVGIVLLLNLSAILLRARISKKLKG